MTSPLVTIVISCYNHEQYVEKSILSALKQTYENIELLVFDDGSKDKSREVIQELKNRENFQFTPHQNQGLSRTLNKGLAMAKGQYFVPFGSDDIMLPDRIEKQVAYMEAHSESVACAGNTLKIDENGQLIRNQKFNHSAVQSFDDLFEGRGPGAPAPTLFFRTEQLRQAGGFHPEIPLEDLYIQLKITKSGHSLALLNDVLAYYRVHPTNTYKNLDYMLNSVLKTYEQFREEPAYASVKYHFLNSMLLRATKHNSALAKEILAMIPLNQYNMKTWRAIFKLPFKRLK